MDRAPNTTTASRCQWCGATIATDSRHCPACQAAVVDPSLTPEIVALTDASDTTMSLNTAQRARLVQDVELEIQPSVHKPRRAAEDTVLVTLLFFGLAAIGGGAIGFLLGPPLLRDLFISILEVPPADPGAFRPLGAFIGVLCGLLIASGIGIVQQR